MISLLRPHELIGRGQVAKLAAAVDAPIARLFAFQVAGMAFYDAPGLFYDSGVLSLNAHARVLAAKRGCAAAGSRV
jgi:hypothetical protein